MKEFNENVSAVEISFLYAKAAGEVSAIAQLNVVKNPGKKNSRFIKRNTIEVPKVESQIVYGSKDIEKDE